MYMCNTLLHHAIIFLLPGTLNIPTFTIPIPFLMRKKSNFLEFSIIQKDTVRVKHYPEFSII